MVANISYYLVYRYREQGRLQERTMIAENEPDPRASLFGLHELADQIARHEGKSSVVITTFIELKPNPGEKLAPGKRYHSQYDADAVFTRILNRAQMVAMRYPEDMELFELVSQLTVFGESLKL